ncbi:MAG: exodeoxyribonuclease VII small subunit [Thermoflexales bacterium]|nr:exodeoxyribonuclease VII small subunit [Thermoflexales bacterium]MDW8351247.1 exodeoxyribonuclease VII small subunit [Anaerolineae bacterium]
MPKKETAELAIEQLTFEQAFQQLEAIVVQLERGELPLDRSLELYARGQQLAAHCARLLDQAELRVRVMGTDDDDE